MTKIKLLKDIPGYKAGEIMEIARLDIVHSHLLLMAVLEEPAMIEIIKDDIDIEKTREAWKYVTYETDTVSGKKWTTLMTKEEAEWFTAYRIVKAVIEKLNDGWKPEWGKIGSYYVVQRRHIGGEEFIIANYNLGYETSILPVFESEETAEKVISLCEPELKVLFGVK